MAADLAVLARLHNVEVVPHCFSDDVLLAASVHFAASLPELRLVEYPISSYSEAPSLLIERLRPVEGRIRLPPGPGLGIEVDDDEVERRRLS